MKKLLLFCSMIAAAVSAWAEGAWVLVTDSGERVAISQVGMLVAADDATTFSVVKVDGAGDAISGVNSVSFVYDAGWSGIGNVEDTKSDIVIDGVSSTIIVMGCDGREYNIFDVAGKLQRSGIVDGASARINVSCLTKGIYVLKVGDSTVKFKK